MAQVAIEKDVRRPEGRARPPSGAALRRWSLRGAAFLYLGLFIVLPVVAILQHGFGDGLGNLRDALDSFGAKAAMRGEVPGYQKGNPADAERLLEGIFKNVTVLDKSANDSLKNFESGNGDVAITYDYQLATAGAYLCAVAGLTVPSSGTGSLSFVFLMLRAWRNQSKTLS